MGKVIGVILQLVWFAIQKWMERDQAKRQQINEGIKQAEKGLMSGDDSELTAGLAKLKKKG
jgi:predicted transcriptional regulator